MIKFKNTYTTLPSKFFSQARAEKASQPKLLAFNNELAKNELGLDLDQYSEEELAQLFTGQNIPSSASSVALAYAGHQFGNFVPQLGDGRALLLGEIIAPSGKRFDIQLKGSGRTVFSRNGDGKSSLGPVIREYIVSEAMHSLGVPTTRALAAASTGDFVQREESLPGGIFTRVASSHIRIGTFEYFAARDDIVNLKQLFDYTIDRHYPHIRNDENIYLTFLNEVAKAQANLVAKWMSFGFIHGVMNTDNMSISGETIDYGPCAFMDNFNNDRVFSSIDRQGRYAYSNQIPIAKWNLTRLAGCLIPFVHYDENQAISMIEESINSYQHIYEQEWLGEMRRKFGLIEEKPEDVKFINTWLNYLEEEDLDFTLSFRNLSNSEYEFKKTPLFERFFTAWQSRLNEESRSPEEVKKQMESVNPVFIPRNHQVERAIQSALLGDLTIFKEMNQVLKNPFIEQPEFDRYRLPPKAEERIKATFCGT